LTDVQKAWLDDAVRRFGREGALEWVRRMMLYLRGDFEALDGLPPLQEMDRDDG
jgi:hypothetical protein